MKGSHSVAHREATPVVEALSGLGSIRAVLCFGSYATNTNDDRSDIDLFAFCNPGIPSSEIRRQCIGEIADVTNVQIGHTGIDWDDQWCPAGDRFFLNGVLIDLVYNTLEWVETVVSRVAGEGLTSLPEFRFRPYTLLGLLERSLILYDPNSVIAELRARLRPYPAKLKQTLLSESLQVAEGSLQDLQDYVERHIGNSAFHFQMGRVLDGLGTMLFAINECYDPATKRTEEAYRELAVLPNDFMKRFERVLETPMTPAGRRQVLTLLHDLLSDVKGLAN